MRSLLPLLLALAMPAVAGADPLTITKTVTIVSDPLGNAFPRSLPGSIVDYRTRATNPLANSLKTVTGIKLEEPLPADTILYVRDLAGAGKGPVEFADGSLLGTGLLSSGLTYSFVSLSATNDGLEFYDGNSWSYVPVPDAAGFDARVRAIRVTLGSSFAATASFQLRFRAKIR